MLSFSVGDFAVSMNPSIGASSDFSTSHCVPWLGHGKNVRFREVVSARGRECLTDLRLEHHPGGLLDETGRSILPLPTRSALLIERQQ